MSLDPSRAASQPLLLVLRHADAIELMTDHSAAALPDPLHLFLLVSGDPNEMSHGVLPLCHALRPGDASSLSLLLRYWADPVSINVLPAVANVTMTLIACYAPPSLITTGQNACAQDKLRPG